MAGLELSDADIYETLGYVSKVAAAPDPVAEALKQPKWHVVLVPEAGPAEVLELADWTDAVTEIRNAALDNITAAYAFLGVRLHTTVAPTHLLTPHGPKPIFPLSDTLAIDPTGYIEPVRPEEELQAAQADAP